MKRVHMNRSAFVFSAVLCASASAQTPSDHLPAASPVAPSSPTVLPPDFKASKPTVLPQSVEYKLAEKIAKQIIEACPVAEPGDVHARDQAAEKLAACSELMKAAGDKILWGGFHPEQGYDPEAYRLTDMTQIQLYQLTEFTPEVWARLYLSTFMFTGTYEIKKSGRFTVLELDAKFRGDLPPGDYPYPFWHSPNKWTAYMMVQKVAFVFEPGRLLAALRVSPLPESVKQIRRPWDTKWSWTDEKGNPQPRVSLYSYMFSKDNPHVEGLEKTYREMEAEFRAQNCMQCHEPDNRSRMNDLLLMNYPNQALVMRKNLVTVLESNIMPPGSVLAHEPAGIQDQKVREHLLRLAKSFEKQADEALAFEKSRAK
jgi:hypothetical protein